MIGAGDAGSAPDAAMLCRRTLLSWHERFSRFLETSELSKLNDDPRGEVPVRTLMARFAQAVHSAGSMTGGLVDATLLVKHSRLPVRAIPPEARHAPTGSRSRSTSTRAPSSALPA